ncbi:hypothetical protein Q5P01_010859 [Channa striata]|uniref:Uncharacterized protein n=1 Tax=Channa striata TaxID=64152 RepID=A0AA88MSC6_CHASR|nr:hypothetical protein Q5P01_010859 [Channa striata]
MMEEPANRSSGAFTSQNSSLSSLDYSDLTLSQPALPASEAGVGEDKESALFESPTPTSLDQRFGSDAEDLSQWQSEFRGQIRALRQWLKSMEMRLACSGPQVESSKEQMMWLNYSIPKWLNPPLNHDCDFQYPGSPTGPGEPSGEAP